MKRNLALRFTIWWLNKRKLEFKGIRRIKLYDGRRVQVLVFTSNNSPVLGQCTPCKTIILNDKVLSNEEYVNRVLIHESVHQKQWYSWIIYLTIPLGIVGFIILPFALAQCAISIVTYDLYSFSATYLPLIISICLISIPVALSWILEYKAEEATFKEMGLDRVFEIDEEIRQEINPVLNPVDRIIRFLTHPPSSLVRKTYCYLNKDAK